MHYISFMDPLLFWIGAPTVLLLGCAMAWYNTKGVEQARKFYGTEALLDLFSPRNFVQMRALWAQWILFFLVIVAAAAGPNASSTPTLARAGALQVEAIYDVSNSMNAEDYEHTISRLPVIRCRRRCISGARASNTPSGS